MTNNKHKILFVGVFDSIGKSTNTSQILAFKKLGYNVMGYQFRQKAVQMGPHGRDEDLLTSVKTGNFDLVIYSKGNGISLDTFKQIREHSKTCLWYMDPLVSYVDEMREKTSLVDFACFDKKNVLKEAKKLNNNCFYVCEGFDSLTDVPCEKVIQKTDIGFIGTVYGNRQKLLENITKKVKISNNVFGFDHPRLVSETKINLNFCTSQGASDRIYKILGAKGFLLSDDWMGREEHFQNGKDLIIYKDVKDLNDKIDYYLKNEEEREKIAASGYQTVQKFNRLNWAKEIIKIYEEIINA